MAMSFSMVAPGSISTSFSFLRILCSMIALGAVNRCEGSLLHHAETGRAFL